MDKKALILVLNKTFSAIKMERTSNSWYKQTRDIIQMVNCQKSQYSNQFYLNVCLSPVQMNIEGFPGPKEHKFPIRIRMSALFVEISNKVNMLFNLEDEKLSDEERASEISQVINQNLVPFLISTETIEDIRAKYSSGVFSGGLVSLTAKANLGL